MQTARVSGPSGGPIRYRYPMGVAQLAWVVGALVLVLVGAPACKRRSAPSPDAAATASPTAQVIRRGAGGFPLPSGATGGSGAPGGGGKIVMYEVPRSRDAVAAEVRVLLTQDGWTTDASELSPRGSVRLTASKDGKTVKASVAGDASRAALILTLP